MPCRDWDNYTEADRREDAARAASREEIDAVCKKLDEVTSMLCGVCTMIDRGYRVKYTPELRAWWEEHKRRDEENREFEERKAKRLAEEAAAIADRVRLLDELGPEKRKILGL